MSTSAWRGSLKAQGSYASEENSILDQMDVLWDKMTPEERQSDDERRAAV